MLSATPNPNESFSWGNTIKSFAANAVSAAAMFEGGRRVGEMAQTQFSSFLATKHVQDALVSKLPEGKVKAVGSRVFTWAAPKVFYLANLLVSAVPSRVASSAISTAAQKILSVDKKAMDVAGKIQNIADLASLVLPVPNGTWIGVLTAGSFAFPKVKAKFEYIEQIQEQIQAFLFPPPPR